MSTFLVGLGVVGVILVILLAFISAKGVQKTATPAQDGPNIPEQLQSRYQDYSPAAFASGVGKKRVLFFYAPWCPTCRPTDAAFRASPDEIPEDVIVYRVNYDTETQLKQMYGITYQHTFVWVDAEGNPIRKWNGGMLPELISNTQS